MRKILILSAAFVATLGVATAALAHHAVNAQFDIDKEKSITGTMAKLDNVQPHSYWYFIVQKPGAAPEKWAIEGPSPGNLRRAGLRMKEDVQVGKSFTVYFNPSRDGSRTGYLRGVSVAGKRVNLTPDYITPPDSK